MKESTDAPGDRTLLGAIPDLDGGAEVAGGGVPGVGELPSADPRLRSAWLGADPARLEAQLELSWDREWEILCRAGLTDGMDVVDFGCGPGHVARRLLDRLPHSSVIAVDLDPEMVRLASLLLENELGRRAEVIEASATCIGLPDGCCDLAHARHLFQHAVAPEVVASEMFSVLRPGGMVAVVDIDDALGGVHHPDVPLFRQMGELVRTEQLLRGGNRTLGRHLPSLLSHAGFVDLRLEVLALDSRELGLHRFIPQYHPQRYERLVATGALTAEALEEYARAFEAFFHGGQPGAFILELLLICTGRKPR